jgi:uncharacterized membrane protein YuzA (DUF378 family)
MSTINPGLGRLLAGVGGALLVAALFMPWSEGGGETLSGWETLDVTDIFFLITGLCGLAAAMTGGLFGFFRPDLSFNAMTDIFGVASALLIGWLLAFDFPEGASREIGAYLALAGAALVATGAGDFRVTSVFPRLR